MEAFPTLSQNPSVELGHQVIIDPVLTSHFESGAVSTRPLFSDIPIKWSVSYNALSTTDKKILEFWERVTVEYGGKHFEWHNTKDGKDYESQLAGPISYSLHPQSAGNLWTVDLSITVLGEL